MQFHNNTLATLNTAKKVVVVGCQSPQKPVPFWKFPGSNAGANATSHVKYVPKPGVCFRKINRDWQWTLSHSKEIRETASTVTTHSHGL